MVQVAALDPGSTTAQRLAVASGILDLPTTSPARTVADCLRHLPVADAVALGDSALRCGRVEWSQVARDLERQRSWPYAAHGLAGLLQLDPRRETWLESLSFVTFVLLGGPRPEP